MPERSILVLEMNDNDRIRIRYDSEAKAQQDLNALVTQRSKTVLVTLEEGKRAIVPMNVRHAFLDEPSEVDLL
jgi:hypothetical protein